MNCVGNSPHFVGKTIQESLCYEDVFLSFLGTSFGKRLSFSKTQSPAQRMNCFSDWHTNCFNICNHGRIYD
jgi:hypothetical protein